MDDKELILNFFKKNNYCVVASLGDEYPQSAVVAFSETEDLNIVFSTSTDTRKFKNIKNNPKTSITIGWDPTDFTTVQMDGESYEITENIEKYIEYHVNKHPVSAKYAHNPDNKYFMFKPKWLRFTDSKTKKIIEFETQ